MVVRKPMAMKSGSKCNCNVSYGLFALILLAAGFWIVINGIMLQWNTSALLTWWEAMLWYLAGFLVLMVGKMCKWKSHDSCSAHGHHCH